MRAAGQISRMALGDPDAEIASTIYRLPRVQSQKEWVEGAPIGTRGGLSVMHNFPADGKYVFHIMPYAAVEGEVFGRTFGTEQMEVSDRRHAGRPAGDRPVDERIRAERAQHPHGLYLRDRRPEARVGRLHPPVRGGGGRPHPPHRPHTRGRTDRDRTRRYHPAAPAAGHHPRSLRHHRNLRDPRTAEGVHLPSHDARGGAALRARHHLPSRDQGLPASRSGGRRGRAAQLL